MYINVHNTTRKRPFNCCMHREEDDSQLGLGLEEKEKRADMRETKQKAFERKQ